MRGLLLVMMALGTIPLLEGPAAGASAQVEAKKQYREGMRQLKKRRWHKALDAFQESQRLSPSSETLVQIGATYAEMGRPIEALEAYDQALKDQGLSPQARARAEKEVQGLEAQVGWLAVEAPAGTQVKVRDRNLGPAPLEPMRLMPGSYPVMLAVPGREPIGAIAMIVAGQTETVRAPVEEAAPVAPAPVAPPAPAPTPAPPAAPAPPEPAPAGPPRTAVDVDVQQSTPLITQRRLAWGTVALGGAMLVAGGVFAVLAHSADSDVEDCLEAPRWTSSCDDAVERRGDYAPAAYWLTGAGAAAAVAGGVWLYLLGDEPAAPATAGVRVLPGGAVVTLRLARY